MTQEDQTEVGVAQGVDGDVFARVRARCDAASAAGATVARAHTAYKNELLMAIAAALVDGAPDIARANAVDMAAATKDGMDAGKLDRLRFDAPRIADAAQGVRHVASLPDPIGEVVRGYTLEDGLRLNQVRVPMGLIGMIYEARPNVTVDVTSLCLKSGNAVVLYGGHAARHTNEAILEVVHAALRAHGADPNMVSSVDAFGRPGADSMMRARGHVDVLVPRGGAGLIQSVVRHATVPVIETGAGNVHIYIDASADFDKAVPIVINAKTQRVGVCNAAEKLIVHRDAAAGFLPIVARALGEAGVQLRSDDAAYGIIHDSGIPVELRHATEEDWDTEYLALIMGVKVVDSLDDAIAHINRHSTGHTEAIIAEDYSAVERFTTRIDSAVVMVNASTRFTDGGVFGFGAELGISTQKMYARGPMGLREMTTTKWIGYGMGQVRA